MGNLDFSYYLSVFWRRFPYFLVVAAFVSAIGLAIASILPPVYQAAATMVVETPQISDDLAQSTVPVNAVETIQIIEERLMTRANLLDLAERFKIYADRGAMSANTVVDDMRARTVFTTDRPTRAGRPVEGATVISVSFDAPTATMAAEVANEIATLILQENVKLRTGRASDTLDFFEQEVNRLSAEIDRNAAQIMAFKRENPEALPDSLEFRRNEQAVNQERLLQIEREATTLRDARARVVAIYEQTGRVLSDRQMSPEEQDLAQLRQQVDQALAVYSETSPNVTVLRSRIAALEPIVAEQLALVNPAYAGLSEYEIQLAQFDGPLAAIAEERARIETRLAELDASIRATPANEMSLSALERDQANIRVQYDTALTRLAQAQVGERIEVLAKGERFSLVEQATPPAAPVRPNRLLIGGGSVAAGLGAGLGLVLLLEMLNRSIRRPVELTAKLGIQPLATVPYIQTRREVGWKRGIIATALTLIAIAIPALLFALHTYYLPLDLVLHNLATQIGLGDWLGRSS